MFALDEAIRGYEEALRLNPKESYRGLIDRLSRRKALAEAYGERALEYAHVVTPIAIEIATDLIPYVTGPASGGLSEDVLADINILRAGVTAQFGVAIPGLRFRGNDGDFAAGTYVVKINEVPLVTGRLALTQRFCASAPESVSRLGITGDPATDPLTGAPGVWINRADWAAVESRQLELWSITHYIVRHVESIVRKNLDDFVGHQEIAVMTQATAPS